MDPIPREPSPSYLPIAGLIAGLVGLLLGAIALVKASKAGDTAAEAATQNAALASRIDGIESNATNASAAADRVNRGLSSLETRTMDGFATVASEFGKTNAEVAKLQEALARGSRTNNTPTGTNTTPTANSTTTARPPADVASPGEYSVKSGDTGMKIATAHGIDIKELKAANPGVNWNALKVDQKIKLPKK